MSSSLIPIFQESYRELRPRAPMPEFEVRFFRFANINNTIRLREGKVLARLSDLLEGAPEAVLRAIAHILLAKLYRKPIRPADNTYYHRYVSSQAMREQTHRVRRLRGRKHLASPRGQIYDLEQIFDELNLRYFHGLLGRPQMTWSREAARHMLGHYDPAHNAIVVSRVFDHPRVPRYAVDYIVFHEMLHLKHPVRLRGSRRCVHPPAFQEEEKLFADLAAAKQFLKQL